MAQLLPQGKQYYETATGIPLVGGQVFTYDVGTTNPRVTYSDEAQTNPNTNPVILDARGEAVIFWDGDYTVTLQDALGNTIWSVDGINSNNASLLANFTTDQGSVNALIANGISTGNFQPGMTVDILAQSTNTGATTLNYDGLGVKNVTLLDGPLLGGEIQTGSIYRLEYDGTEWQLTNPSIVNKLSVLETAASVIPTDFRYPYGCPRRFGAVGDGVNDDTAAVQAAINSHYQYVGWPGDNYGVTTVTFPANTNFSEAFFNTSEITGIATSPTICVVQIKTSFAQYYDYTVNCNAYAGVIHNSNYTCGTWWFNGHISTGTTGIADGASQYNNFFGCLHVNFVRGMVYGQLPTSTSSATTTHSENTITGWRTISCSNPFYSNSDSGFVHFNSPTFARSVGVWTTPTMPATGRALETPVGNVYVNGGEIIFSDSTTGYGADLIGTVMNNVYLEGAVPAQIMGNNVRMTQCRFLMTTAGFSAFKANGVAGIMEMSGCTFFRSAGVGAFDRTPFFDGFSVPTFEVLSNANTFFEWGFVNNQANVKLIQGCSARYFNTRYSLTAADPNIYLLNDPKISIVPQLTLDDSGYTNTGWVKLDNSGSGTFSVSTSAGPPGYLASQLQIANATGQSVVLSGDSTSLTTIKASMYRVSPGEEYWLSSWMNMTAGGTNAALEAQFFTLTGTSVSTVKAADNTSIGSGAWVYVEGGIPVPATAAYMAFGVLMNTGTLQFLRVRCQRALY